MLTFIVRHASSRKRNALLPPDTIRVLSISCFQTMSFWHTRAYENVSLRITENVWVLIMSVWVLVGDPRSLSVT